MSAIESLDKSIAPVLVLLHGATINQRMWDPVRRHLDPRYPVLALDLPGHGTRRAEPYTAARTVAVVAVAVQSLAPAPVILVGDSLGAYSAMLAASALPQERLLGLVLGGATFNFRGANVLPYRARGALFRFMTAVVGEDRLVKKLLPKLQQADNSGFALSAADAQALVDGGIRFNAFGEAVGELRRIDFLAKLAAIRQPVLIVNGDKDRVNVNDEPAFLAVAQHATARRFANCEHGVSMRRSRDFALLVNEFAARVGAAAPAALSA